MTLLPEFRAQLHEAATRRAARRRPYLAVRPAFAAQVLRPLPAVFAIAIVIAIASMALLTLHAGRTPAPPAKSSPSHTQAPNDSAPVWLKALERRFWVFAGHASAPTAELVQAFERSGVAADDLRFAHRVALPAGAVWIAPTATQLCIAFKPTGVHDLLGVTCSAITQAKRFGVRLSVGGRAHPASSPGPSNPLISWHAGVIPNGVTRVRLRIGAGAFATSAVRQNTFVIAVSNRDSSPAIKPPKALG